MYIGQYSPWTQFARSVKIRSSYQYAQPALKMRISRTLWNKYICAGACEYHLRILGRIFFLLWDATGFLGEEMMREYGF